MEVWGVGLGSLFSFMDTQLFFYCGKDYPFAVEFLHPLPTEFNFCWKLADTTCVFVSGPCLILICYVLMSVPYCLPYCGFMYGLKLVSINPPALFIIFKTVSGILGFMYFHKYFKIGLLVSKTSWNFNCNCLEFLDQFVENCCLNSEFPNLSFI